MQLGRSPIRSQTSELWLISRDIDVGASPSQSNQLPIVSINGKEEAMSSK